VLGVTVIISVDYEHKAVTVNLNLVVLVKTEFTAIFPVISIAYSPT
jgi:hypothetical protein